MLETKENLLKQVIKKISQGCASDQEKYCQAMFRTAWRVEDDFRFIQKQIGHIDSTLDIGAVPPLLVGLLADIGYQNLMVVDPNAALFEKFFQSNGIDYLSADILTNNIDLSQQFELVCFCEVIEHLGGNLIVALQSVTNTVAPDGFLYLTTPNLRSISGIFALIGHHSGLASKPGATIRSQYERTLTQYGYYGHLREYTEKEMIDLVESMGFTHVKSSYQRRPYARAHNKLERVAIYLEKYFPKLRLFGKYLFKRN